MALRSYTRFKQLNPTVEGRIITERHRVGGVAFEVIVPSSCSDWKTARAIKVILPKLVPWHQVLYMDADTMVNGDLSAAWGALDAGFDFVIVPSRQQGKEVFWHVDSPEREDTLEQLHTVPLQLQCGMLLYQRTPAVLVLFETWEKEWFRYQGQDQAAFMRALVKNPVRIHLLGRPFNDGAVVAHRWGELGRND
jgi:lipopolysaccharide biosynthesis glycosyltransferase